MRKPEEQNLVLQLGHPKAEVRQFAAEQLYKAGSAIAQEVLDAWDRINDLKGLISGPPTVGVAVQRDHFATIRTAWGSPPLAHVPPDQHVEEFEIHFRHASLDILTLDESSPKGALDKFLRNHGEGIQQVELWTTDVKRVTSALRTQQSTQLKLVYDTPREGGNGTLINFVLFQLKNGNKALIELVQPRPRSKTDLQSTSNRNR